MVFNDFISEICGDNIVVENGRSANGNDTQRCLLLVTDHPYHLWYGEIMKQMQAAVWAVAKVVQRLYGVRMIDLAMVSNQSACSPKVTHHLFCLHCREKTTPIAVLTKTSGSLLIPLCASLSLPRIPRLLGLLLSLTPPWTSFTTVGDFGDSIVAMTMLIVVDISVVTAIVVDLLLDTHVEVFGNVIRECVVLRFGSVQCLRKLCIGQVLVGW